MQAFSCHTGKVLPFARTNVDTDAILPKQYLKSISKFGYGNWLFDDMRYLDSGDVSTDPAQRRPNPDFILNQPEYAAVSILLAKDNFGCGSSREHAVWALRDYGIKVIIAPSFADIFYNNCFKNGLLPITLPADMVTELFALCQSPQQQTIELTIDLQQCEIVHSTKRWPFMLDSNRRANLLSGHDDISVTLLDAALICQFEQQLQNCEPWIFR